MMVVEARRRVRALASPPSGSTRQPRSRVGVAVLRLVERIRALLRVSDEDTEHALVLESVARALRSGASLAHALIETAESLPSSRTVGELRSALVVFEQGAPVTEAVEAWVSTDPTATRSLAGAALALGAEVGGARARALDGAAAGLRDRADLLREVRALSSQARSSALVMVLAPVVFAGLAWTTDRDIARLMCATPLGWSCLALGLALDAVGAWWMAKLTARVA